MIFKNFLLTVLPFGCIFLLRVIPKQKEVKTMTRKEAIEELIKTKDYPISEPASDEALDMAIEALEQEVLIKRNNYDKINVPLFKSGKDNNYLCSMCGQYTTLSDSVSYQGYNIICNHCLYKMAHIFRKPVGVLVLLIQDEGESRKAEEEKNE